MLLTFLLLLGVSLYGTVSESAEGALDAICIFLVLLFVCEIALKVLAFTPNEV